MKKTITYILFVAFAIRLVGSGQSLWLDEATSAIVVRSYNLKEIITTFAINDFHPPLYYLSLKLWSVLLGTSEFGLRALSVLLGVATLYIVYLIAKKQFSNLTANIAALLFATAPLHVYYSHEARMYSMAAFFVSVSVYAFVSSLKKQSSKMWLLFIASIFLAIATDYLTVFMLPVFLLIALKNRRKKKWFVSFVKVFIVSLTTLLLFVPLLKVQLTGGLNVRADNPGWWQVLGVSSLKNILLVPVKFVIGRISLSPRALYGLFVLVALSIFSVPLIKAVKNNARIYWYWLIIPILISIMVGFFVPVLSYFRLLYALPALSILLAIGLSNIKDKYFLPVLFALLAIQFFSLWKYSATPTLQREDWRRASRFMQEESKDKSIQIVYVKNSQMEALRYYWLDAPAVGPEGLSGDTDIIWLMRYVQTIFDPEDKTRSKVESMSYTKESEHSFNGVVVWRYHKNENSD